MKGIGESVGNLVGGKGFRTDSEVEQRKAELLAEYNRVKDMTLLAANRDAGMPDAVEAAIDKERIIRELGELDEKAAKDAYDSSAEGKVEKAKKEALLKREVDAAMAEFDKMNANGEMTSNFIEIKDGGKTIIKKDEMGTPSVEYSFDENGRTVGMTLYPDIGSLQKNPYSIEGFDYSKTEAFCGMDPGLYYAASRPLGSATGFKGMDSKVYDGALATVLQDTMGMNEIATRPKEPGLLQGLLIEAIKSSADKSNDTIGKFGKEVGISILKQTWDKSDTKKDLQEMMNNIPGFVEELWSSSSTSEKMIYGGVLTAVGASLGYELYDNGARMPIKFGDNSILIAKKEGKFSMEAEWKVGDYSGEVKSSKMEKSASVDYKGTGFSVGANVEYKKTEDGDKKVKVGVQGSLEVNKDLTLKAKVNYKTTNTVKGPEWLFNANGNMDNTNVWVEVNQRLNELKKKRERNVQIGASRKF
ncbi:MAG: hypothetical protein KBH06_01715 [Spirochaetes bacterium]|nr:hypothetical protein [Spirochaetota bacterium]